MQCFPNGVSFVQAIQGYVPDCRAVVAVIDPEWRVSDAASERRYEQPRDFVAFELDLAFRAGIPVIPALVRGASMPKEADLPDTLKPLAQLNAVTVRADDKFDADIDRLVEVLRGL